MQSKWILRLVTALLWALAAGSAVVWGLRMGGQGFVPDGPPDRSAMASGEAGARPESLARLLGAINSVATPQALVPTISRFSLAGVVAQGRGGAALIVVDGKPPKPYAVGSRLDEGTVLQSVGPRYAVLAASMDGPPGQRLDLPPPGQGLTVNSAKTAGIPGSVFPPRTGSPASP